MAVNDLGDLIVTLKLDDDGFREQLGQAVGDSRKEIAAATRSTAELNRGIRALGSSLQFVTGESGFMAMQLARTGTHMAALAASAGGMIGALKAMTVAVASNPVAVAFTAIAAAAATAYRWISSTNDQIAKQREAAKALPLEWEGIRDASQAAAGKTIGDIRDQIDVIRGTMSPERARARELARGGMLIEDAQAVAAQEASLRSWEKHEQAKLDRRKAAILAGEQAYKEGQERMRELDRRNSEYTANFLKNKAEDHEAALRHFAESHARRLRDIRENRDEILRLEEQRTELTNAVSTGTTFGIVGRESGGFRFGPGAIGSVIGEQREEKKQTDLLERIDAKLRELAAIKIALTGEPGMVEP